MEFPFDINRLLPDEITVVDNRLSPFKLQAQQQKSVESLKSDLSKIIDDMGMASSKAQGLKRVITNGIKMGGSDHRLYLMKDASANNGKGAAVGMIKVGQKRLFVVDRYSQQLEVNPLCVLDFYVHEKRQRHGFGLRLFKAMLQMENVKPQFLAFDRPSSKFLNFLKKYFGFQNMIHQMNNYTLFEDFFKDLSAVGYVQRNRRFVNSAPVDSRLRSLQDERRASSASSFGRQASVLSNDLSQLKGQSSSHTSQSSGIRQQASGVMSDLPPRPTGRHSRAPKEASWNRRNASNVSFASNKSVDQPKVTSKPSSDTGNLYSRHTYPQTRSKTIDALYDITAATPPQSTSRKMTSHPQIPSREVSDKKRIIDFGSHHYKPSKEEMYSSNRITAHQSNTKSGIKTMNTTSEEKSVPKAINPSSDKSYTVNNMYRKDVSLGSSSPGTSWNLFGVNINSRGPASNSLENTKARIFPS